MRLMKRNGTVDFMRFIFSMLIVVYHGRNLGKTPEIALFAEAGHIGVEFFFLVSGFLMAKSATGRPSARSENLGTETIGFLWKKIKPMLAFYIFAVLVSYGGIAVRNEYTVVENLRNLMLGVWDFAFLRVAGIGTYSLTSGTWYLSAMLLGMLILYPMLCKWKTQFTHIIAPLIAIFGLGYLAQEYGNLNQYVNNWDVVYSGLIRGLAELSLGCVCYEVCEKLKIVQFTSFARILITLVEMVGYAGVIYCTTNLPAKYFDFFMLLCLAVCVTLSFSAQGISAKLFQGKMFPLLGRLSLVIYLNHFAVKDMVAWLFPQSLGYRKLMLIYIAGVFFVSGVCLVWEVVLTKFWGRYGTVVRSWFVKSSERV